MSVRGRVFTYFRRLDVEMGNLRPGSSGSFMQKTEFFCISNHLFGTKHRIDMIRSALQSLDHALHLYKVYRYQKMVSSVKDG